MATGEERSAIELIAPIEASRLLDANNHNRNLQQSLVDNLASRMTGGEWAMNGATIKVAVDGTLLDGQHRLAAVVASGIPLETVVVRGLPMGAQETLDIGRGRRLADVLAIEGHDDAHALAAAINVLHRYRTGQRLDGARNAAPSAQQALTLIDEAPELREGVRVARRVTKQIRGPLGVFAGLHAVFRAIDSEANDKFFAQLETGLELEKGDPVWHLREHVLRIRRDRHYAQTPYYVAALTIKAFNYRRAGRRIDLLSFKATERFPEAGGSSRPDRG
jgi:hypothetical protein